MFSKTTQNQLLLAWSLPASNKTPQNMTHCACLRSKRQSFRYIHIHLIARYPYYYLSSYYLMLNSQISVTTLPKGVICHVRKKSWGLKARCTKILTFLHFLIFLLPKLHFCSIHVIYIYLIRSSKDTQP